MKITDQEVNYILNLSRGEKPEKRIREYLSSFLGNGSQKEKRIEFFNKNYKSFFTDYFKKFTWKHREECILEAYIVSLDRLNNDSLLEDALIEGMKAGGVYYTKQNKYDKFREDLNYAI